MKRKKNDNHIILFFIPTPTMEDELFLPSNEYIILDESDTNVLIKIEFRPLIRHTDHWVYNRSIDDSKVKEYYDSIKENNDIKWHLSAVKEKSSDNFILIDGQHRYEAIKLYLEKDDIQMECNKFVYVNAIKIDNIEKDNEYIIDLFISQITDFTDRNNIMSALLFLQQNNYIKTSIYNQLLTNILNIS